MNTYYVFINNFSLMVDYGKKKIACILNRIIIFFFAECNTTD